MKETELDHHHQKRPRNQVLPEIADKPLAQPISKPKEVMFRIISQNHLLFKKTSTR